MAYEGLLCGAGRSCELICPARKPGEKCSLTLLDFARLLDSAGDAAPERDEVLGPMLVV